MIRDLLEEVHAGRPGRWFRCDLVVAGVDGRLGVVIHLLRGRRRARTGDHEMAVVGRQGPGCRTSPGYMRLSVIFLSRLAGDAGLPLNSDATTKCQPTRPRQMRSACLFDRATK